MRLSALALVGLLSDHCLGKGPSNYTSSLSSHQILPATFKPPQVFKNANLVRSTNLEKSFVRETVNVVIENVDSKPQTEYFLPFRAEQIRHVGGLEVKDKKEPEKPAFVAETVEYDPHRFATRSPSSMKMARY